MKSFKVLFLLLFLLACNHAYSWNSELLDISTVSCNSTPYETTTNGISFNVRVNVYNVIPFTDPAFYKASFTILQDGNAPIGVSYITIDPSDPNTQTAVIQISQYAQFCYNKPARLVAVVQNNNNSGPTETEVGYFIVYKSTPGSYSNCSSNTYAVIDGQETQIGSNWFAVTFGSGCNISAGAYYVREFKVSKTVTFSSGMIVQPQAELSHGYSGANPNNAQMWVGMDNVTSTSANLYTFVYEVKNTAGQNLGWFPCTPQQAAIVYKLETPQAPVLTSLGQYPNPFSMNGGGYVYPILSQGNGNLVYHWSSENPWSGYSVSFVHDRAYITKTSMTEGNEGDNGRTNPWKIKCYVTNQYGTSAQLFWLVSKSNGSGCPTLSFLDTSLIATSIEESRINENTLLAASLDNPSTEITEYYSIANPSIQEDDTVKFQIHEPETSVSNFNLVELIKVNVGKDKMVAVTNEGDIISYTPPATPNTVIVNGNTDTSAIMSEYDNNSQLVEKNTSFDITYNQSLTTGAVGHFLILRIKNVSVKADVAALVSTNGFEEAFYCRNSDNTICIKLPSNQDSINIAFQQPMEVDQMFVTNNADTNYSVTTLPVISAIHNIEGDVKNQLSDIDGKYGVISSQEVINFEFDNTPDYVDAEYERSFYILRCIGYYTDPTGDVDNASLNSTSLKGNYPNPFNPTTKIVYSLQHQSKVVLKVYDMLGREVANLVNTIQPQGIYNVNFNGSNLASGVYFYKMEVTSPKDRFVETRRMILIK